MPTDMQTAVLSNNPEAIRRVVSSSNVNTVDAEGYTPLYFACMKSAVTPATIEDIISIGAMIDVRGSDGETALYIATFNGRADIVKLLLSHKAGVSEPNGSLKETALHAAARFGHGQLVTMLLKNGADINARNRKQETPLFAAAKAGRHDTACLLLEAGANATVPNEDGKTPLFIASEKGYKHVVIVLKADKQDLRHAKADADAELRLRPMPVASTLEMTDRAAADEAYGAQMRRRSSGREHVPDTTPMEVVDIHVPQPRANAADPFTGKSNGPCRSLEDVGYDKPPPIPEELQHRPPAQLPRVGGTSLVVGTGTEEGGREPIRVDAVSGDASVEFYAPAKK